MYQPVFYGESPRLILRDYRPEDDSGVHACSSDPENVARMVYGPNTPDQTRHYFDQYGYAILKRGWNHTKKEKEKQQ